MAEDAVFTAFESRSNTWSTIGRLDPTAVTSASEAQEPVLVAAGVGDTIYGYDAKHNFFKVEGDGFTRTVIGSTGMDMAPTGEIGVDYLDIRGMAYDAANDRLLVVAAYCVDSEDWTDEYVGSTAIYQVNLETGALEGLVSLTYEDPNSGMLSNIRGLVVDGEGKVYVYSAFDDYFSEIDMFTGAYTHKCSLQSLSIYGSSEHNMPMAYDADTGLVYCLFTSNGSFHQLLSFNPLTAQVKDLGDVGQVVENEETWEYEGPTFTALIVK